MDWLLDGQTQLRASVDATGTRFLGLNFDSNLGLCRHIFLSDDSRLDFGRFLDRWGYNDLAELQLKFFYFLWRLSFLGTSLEANTLHKDLVRRRPNVRHVALSDSLGRLGSSLHQWRHLASIGDHGPP